MAYGGIYGFLLGFMEPIFPYTFDPLFGPLLGLGSPLTGVRVTVAAVTITVAVLYTLITYYLMDLEKYQKVKDEISEIQEKMKEAQENEDMGESTDHMKKSFKKQLEMMKTRQKPMLVTFLLFFLVFPWLFATFNPIVTLPAADGGYQGDFAFNGGSMNLQVQNQTGNASVLVDGENYEVGETFRMDDLPWKVKNIKTDDSANVELAAVVWYSPVPLPGTGKDVGWLATYILLNIPVTMYLSKKLGIQ
ncbi:MAG: EMC3/TMCO1 family protein [Candidatus Nanohaloarchaeota archaeon QJJ-7]|nr:EMC3/TMCO1 family protein [Candidatus Nanohaloarchaeota archaeon QJJ-7]